MDTSNCHSVSTKSALADSSSSSSSSSSPPRRLLGAVEAYLHFRQRMDDCLDSCVAIVRSVGEPIEKQLLLRALTRLSARHPMLRASIKETGSGDDSFPYMEINEEIVPDLEVIASEDWISVIEEDIKKGFAVGAVQWRVKLLQSKRIDDEKKQNLDETRDGGGQLVETV